MITRTPATFLDALLTVPAPSAPMLPTGVFMVMPRAFEVDPESARDNVYMDTDVSVDPDRARAQGEALAHAVEAAGVEVVRFPGHPDTPDDIFPNNVFATTPGRLVVGRMFHPTRQREALRQDIRDYFTVGQGRRLVDLSEGDGVGELTGALVIDRARGVGFCGMSNRVDEAGLVAMHEAFGLQLTFAFDLQPDEYHTNVVMSVLANRACVIHPGGLVDPLAADAVAQAYPGRTLFLDEAEKNAFAGNCIALTDTDLFMSQTGADALRPQSLAALESWGFTLHAVELDEIEKAGGSLRCMLAEIY